MKRPHIASLFKFIITYSSIRHRHETATTKNISLLHHSGSIERYHKRQYMLHDENHDPYPPPKLNRKQVSPLPLPLPSQLPPYEKVY